MAAGVFVVLVVLAVSAWLIYTGNVVAGTILGTVDVVGLLLAFLTAVARHQPQRKGDREVQGDGDGTPQSELPFPKSDQ